MARSRKAHGAEDIWHLGIDDLLPTPREPGRLASSGPFAINLSTSTASIPPPPKTFRQFDGLHVYQLRRGSDATPRFHLRLGIVATEIEADAILAQVLEHYPGATKCAVEEDDQGTVDERARAAAPPTVAAKPIEPSVVARKAEVSQSTTRAALAASTSVARSVQPASSAPASSPPAAPSTLPASSTSPPSTPSASSTLPGSSTPLVSSASLASGALAVSKAGTPAFAASAPSTKVEAAEPIRWDVDDLLPGLAVTRPVQPTPQPRKTRSSDVRADSAAAARVPQPRPAVQAKAPTLPAPTSSPPEQRLAFTEPPAMASEREFVPPKQPATGETQSAPIEPPRVPPEQAMVSPAKALVSAEQLPAGQLLIAAVPAPEVFSADIELSDIEAPQPAPACAAESADHDHDPDAITQAVEIPTFEFGAEEIALAYPTGTPEAPLIEKAEAPAEEAPTLEVTATEPATEASSFADAPMPEALVLELLTEEAPPATVDAPLDEATLEAIAPATDIEPEFESDPLAGQYEPALEPAECASPAIGEDSTRNSPETASDIQWEPEPLARAPGEDTTLEAVGVAADIELVLDADATDVELVFDVSTNAVEVEPPLEPNALEVHPPTSSEDPRAVLALLQPPEPLASPEPESESLEQLVARIDALVQHADERDRSGTPPPRDDITIADEPRRIAPLAQPAATEADPPPARAPAPTIASTQTIRALTQLDLADDQSSQWFSIQLALSEEPIDPAAVPNLDLFSEYRLYSVAGLTEDSRLMHALRLGFFSSPRSAEAVAGYLNAFFDSPSLKRVSTAERDRFARDAGVSAGKDVGATGLHAIIELAGQTPLPERRVSTPIIPQRREPESVWSRLVAPLKR